MSCACPTSSCTFAVSASLRCSVGARRIHSRSGRTPISSELPCISMNLTSRRRYSSGIGSPASTCPPPCTYARNCCSSTTGAPSYRTFVRVDRSNGDETRGADATGGASLRGKGLPRHVDRRSGGRDGGAEGVPLRAHRLEGGPPLRD